MKKIVLGAAAFVAVLAAGYVAEVRHMEKNWYKTGGAMQCDEGLGEREQVALPLTESILNGRG